MRGWLARIYRWWRGLRIVYTLLPFFLVQVACMSYFSFFFLHPTFLSALNAISTLYTTNKLIFCVLFSYVGCHTKSTPLPLHLDPLSLTVSETPAVYPKQKPIIPSFSKQLSIASAPRDPQDNPRALPALATGVRYYTKLMK